MKHGPIKRHGGKAYLAPTIRGHSPSDYTHRLHPFAGGLGELWGWDAEGVSEAVNDLDGDVANFWTVLRCEERFDDFARLAAMTPMSEDVFEHCGEKEWASDVERAWAFFVRNRQSRQALGTCYATPTRRIRRGMNEQVSAWLTAVDGLYEFHQRLRRVEVCNKDAVTFIRKRDHGRAFHYCDPPYMGPERTSGGEYGDTEMSEDDHERLLNLLAVIDGKFMLSGYHSDLYDEFAEVNRWRVLEFQRPNAAASGAAKQLKTEVLWMNY